MPDDATVHVIDDDEAVRQSLEFLLKGAKLPVETHESANAFLAALPRLTPSPGCVITDIRMPGISGIDLLKQLRQLPQPVPVIVITGHGDVPLAVTAMKYGAVDFLEKPFDDDVLLRAVQTALDRRQKDGRREAERAAALDKLAALTARERQVLDGLVAGKPNKAIAHDLAISPRTVEIYRANVMSKTDAASLSDLVRMALSAGLLESAPE